MKNNVLPVAVIPAGGVWIRSTEATAWLFGDVPAVLDVTVVVPLDNHSATWAAGPALWPPNPSTPIRNGATTAGWMRHWREEAKRGAVRGKRRFAGRMAALSTYLWAAATIWRFTTRSSDFIVTARFLARGSGEQQPGDRGKKQPRPDNTRYDQPPRSRFRQAHRRTLGHGMAVRLGKQPLAFAPQIGVGHQQPVE